MRRPRTKKEREGGLPLKIAVIVASVTAILAIPSCIATIIASLQSPNPPPIYSDINVHAYPKKLVYTAGEDDELDLAGGVICYSEDIRKSEGDICTKKRCADVEDMNQAVYYGYVHCDSDVDFDSPGTYTVTLRIYADEEDERQCSFPIQVISPDYVE